MTTSIHQTWRERQQDWKVTGMHPLIEINASRRANDVKSNKIPPAKTHVPQKKKPTETGTCDDGHVAAELFRKNKSLATFMGTITGHS